MANAADVVIGFHENDFDFAKKLAEKLKRSGLTVWHSRPNGDVKETSEAILGCKVFIPIMTEQSAIDKNLNDQLSLAYISNSATYPLAKVRFRFISAKLNGGTRLILAKINWCFVMNDDEFEQKTDALIESVKADIANISKMEVESLDTSGGFIHTHGTKVQLGHGVGQDLGGDGSGFEGAMERIYLSDKDTPFWERHFKGKNEVTWVEFRDNFMKDYGLKITEDFANKEERKKYFVNLMYKDVFYLNKIVTKAVYDKFSEDTHPHAFFNRMQEYTLAYSSLRDVLSMDSSLRIPTIQSLGRFSFPAIVAGLSDMLRDDDPNVRAVAAIALAHAGKNASSTVDKLVTLLEDEDRLVRESGCLSLGYLRSSRAVSHIVDRWRNDPISTVRQAAELALSRMDAPDAQKCMRVTQVLSSEMNALKPAA